MPVEVVPGISAANGAAAAAQIPLTHRDAASIVSFVAGQCKGLSDQDWAGLAGKGRTLVIYMGVKTAPQIAEKLMADGLAPDMPVAVIENAARPDMRVLRGPLAGPARPGRARDGEEPGADRDRRSHRARAMRARHRTIAAGDCSMKILTGNDLKTGAVIWWNGQRLVAPCRGRGRCRRRGRSDHRPRGSRAPRQRCPMRSMPSKTDDGPRPAHIKDRIRALGPTVRPDLTLKPADPEALATG